MYPDRHLVPAMPARSKAGILRRFPAIALAIGCIGCGGPDAPSGDQAAARAIVLEALSTPIEELGGTVRFLADESAASVGRSYAYRSEGVLDFERRRGLGVVNRTRSDRKEGEREE